MMDLLEHSGSEECVDLLIKAGADVNMAEQYGLIALLAAAYYFYEKLTELLIDAGANVNAQDCYGRTTLMNMLEFNNLDYS